MSLLADARVLMALARGTGRTGSHADRLERFYGPQAADYDRFRERLLQGRHELIDRLPVAEGARVVELGAGTGRNLEFFGERLARFGHVYAIDLCGPLIRLASARMGGRANVTCVLADATRWQPAAPVDAVYFAYALTMIPNWRVAVDNALRMLRPGGVLGVVDFFVARHHSLLTRVVWPRWFAHDGVHLSAEQVPYLRARLDVISQLEGRAVMPYLAGASVPYYTVIGRKRP